MRACAQNFQIGAVRVLIGIGSLPVQNGGSERVLPDLSRRSAWCCRSTLPEVALAPVQRERSAGDHSRSPAGWLSIWHRGRRASAAPRYS